MLLMFTCVHHFNQMGSSGLIQICEKSNLDHEEMTLFNTHGRGYYEYNILGKDVILCYKETNNATKGIQIDMEYIESQEEMKKKFDEISKNFQTYEVWSKEGGR